MRELKGKSDEDSKDELEKVVEAIAAEADRKYKNVVEDLKTMKPEGGKIFCRIRSLMFLILEM